MRLPSHDTLRTMLCGVAYASGDFKYRVTLRGACHFVYTHIFMCYIIPAAVDYDHDVQVAYSEKLVLYHDTKSPLSAWTQKQDSGIPNSRAYSILQQPVVTLLLEVGEVTVEGLTDFPLHFELETQEYVKPLEAVSNLPHPRVIDKQSNPPPLYSTVLMVGNVCCLFQQLKGNVSVLQHCKWYAHPQLAGGKKEINTTLD